MKIFSYFEEVYGYKTSYANTIVNIKSRKEAINDVITLKDGKGVINLISSTSQVNM